MAVLQMRKLEPKRAKGRDFGVHLERVMLRVLCLSQNQPPHGRHLEDEAQAST